MGSFNIDKPCVTAGESHLTPDFRTTHLRRARPDVVAMRSRWHRARTIAVFLLVGSASVAATPSSVPADLSLQAPDRTRFVTPPKPVEDFSMPSDDGRHLSLSELRGRALLLFFGFTHCRSVCPTTLKQLQDIRQALPDGQARPEIVFISVDGKRDDVDTIRRYIEPLGEGFRAMTDDPERVKPIAARFSAVFFRGGPTDTTGGYDVEHTSQVYLVNPSGDLVAVFYNPPAQDIADTLVWLSRQVSNPENSATLR